MFSLLILTCNPTTSDCYSVTPNVAFMDKASCEYSQVDAVLIVEDYGYIVVDMVCYSWGSPT